MRILITNDDGINAPGLKTLEKIATKLAGSDGDIFSHSFKLMNIGKLIQHQQKIL